MQPSIFFMYVHMIGFKVFPKLDALLCNLQNLVQIFPKYERQEYVIQDCSSFHLSVVLAHSQE